MIDNELILERLHNGDTTAENQLIENNMGLVAGIAKRFCSRGYELDDLMQIGAVGLIKAVRKFDFEFNVKFSTYAVPLIMGEIRRFIRDDGIIKVSRTHKMNAMKAYHACEALSQKLNRTPTVSEISAECGIECEQIIEAMEATAHPESIHKAFSSDDDSSELIDRMGTVDDESKIIDNVVIKNSLNSLTPRERTVISLRYFSEKTQSSISDIIGVSQVQVSRIEKAALKKMRDYLSK